MSMSGEALLAMGAKRFIEANTAYWEKEPNVLNGQRWIYVFHTLHHHFIATARENIVAKGLQEREQLPIASIISGRSDGLLGLTDQLDASFGIKQRYHLSYHDYNSNQIEVLAEKWATETYGNKDALLQLTYRGIKFGNPLYDDTLRRGETGKRGEVFDCFDISKNRYRTLIRNALVVIDQAYELFADKKPGYLVVSEHVYCKGLYVAVAGALGAKIIITAPDTPDIAVQIDPSKHAIEDIVVSDFIQAQREIYLQKYKATMDNEKLFIVETNNSKAVLPKNEKKNVFILPHSFCDAPRETCKHNIYYDYREWFLDTMRIIKTVPEVNWIIKDHPFASYFGQDRYVRSVFDQNKEENIYWFDKEYSGMKIKEIADCILTCAGDPGIEYWSYGIPTITTSEAYYCSWGISYHMNSLAEYEHTLRTIGNLKKPSQKSSELAKSILAAYKGRGNHADAFTKIFFEFCMKEVDVWTNTGANFGENDLADRMIAQVVCDFCESYTALLEIEDLKSNSIYRLENYVEV